MTKCLNCKKETDNPKFCSRSCTAIFNNKFIKRIPLVEKFCKRCGNKIQRKSYKDKSIFCEDCRKLREKNFNFGDDIPLSSIIDTKRHKSSAFASVRNRARITAKKLGMNRCACGYDKHVEICHKKAISSFSLDTLVSEINSPDNLIALCPTCHWEFDNELLNI